MRMRTPSVLIAVCGLALAAMAAPATAAPASPSADRPHCVLTAQDIRVDRPAAPVRCFATFAESLEAVTVSGATVIGIEYDGKRFGGWSYVIQSSASCSDGATLGIPLLPGRANNQIDSARTYAGCQATHWSKANYQGDQIVCGCSTMPGMSNRTTSILFEPVR